MEEVSRICSDILREIVETAFKDASETVDEVCDSILDILNLDSPGIYSDPIFCNESPMELELEDREELILLDSPAPSPPLHLHQPRPLTLTLCTPTLPLTSGQ